MYKFSYYNIVIPEESTVEDVVIFNTAYESIVKLEKKIYDLISNREFDRDIPYFEELMKQGIVVSSETNEYEKILFEERAEQVKISSKFTVVIAPTLNCNFRCTYCFEEGMRKSVTMSKETMSDILSYMENLITHRSSLKMIHVEWFGGEPLLAFEKVLIPLSKDLEDLCKKHNVQYEASIITNGSLLNEDTIRKLIEVCKISKFQITFDGTKEIYCSRKQVDEAVYKKVKGNVFALSKYIHENNLKIPVHIRLNVDKKNIDDVHRFVEEMKADERYISNLFFYLGKLRFIEDKSNQFFNTQEFEKENLNFNQALGYNKKQKMSRRIWCSQYTVNAIDIGPNGELYKCEHFFGQQDKIVGNVKDGIIYNNAYINYMSQPHTGKCKECKIFPICMGGCPADRFQAQNENCEYSEKYCVEMARKYINK